MEAEVTGLNEEVPHVGSWMAEAANESGSSMMNCWETLAECMATSRGACAAPRISASGSSVEVTVAVPAFTGASSDVAAGSGLRSPERRFSRTIEANMASASASLAASGSTGAAATFVA